MTVALTRTEVERMTADLLQRTHDTTELVLKQSGIRRDDLDELVLVGGSTYMPVVETMLKDICGREPTREMMPEAAVAQGAAIHAAILESRQYGDDSRMAQAIINRLRSVTTSDVNSHSLGVKITDPSNTSRKMNHVMIPKNTTIPASVTQKFVTTSPNQQRVHVHILEGEASDPDACSLIGDFRVTNLPPNLPSGSPVELTYSYDSSGRIHATAIEKSSGKQAETEIVRDSGLDGTGLDAYQSLVKGYSIE